MIPACLSIPTASHFEIPPSCCLRARRPRLPCATAKASSLPAFWAERKPRRSPLKFYAACPKFGHRKHRRDRGCSLVRVLLGCPIEVILRSPIESIEGLRMDRIGNCRCVLGVEASCPSYIVLNISLKGAAKP